MKQNNGYDPKIFTVTKERKEIALLANVGKFCGCGCGKRLEGKKVTRRINKKKVTYYMKVQKDQRFASKYCKDKMYQRTHVQEPKSSLICRIQLKPKQDGNNPFRVLSIYLKQGLKRDYKIVKNTDLWNMIERLTKSLRVEA